MCRLVSADKAILPLVNRHILKYSYLKAQVNDSFSVKRLIKEVKGRICSFTVE